MANCFSHIFRTNNPSGKNLVDYLYLNLRVLIHNQRLLKIEFYADRSGEDGIVVEKRSVRLCP
ncbi:hypothetical protein UB51_14560 [Paenibacillus sp. IHBB 10380]|nr:hypothetical protein UB51_14560 [Paenibacillus sp. IHBB 10380]